MRIVRRLQFSHFSMFLHGSYLFYILHFHNYKSNYNIVWSNFVFGVMSNHHPEMFRIHSEYDFPHRKLMEISMQIETGMAREFDLEYVLKAKCLQFWLFLPILVTRNIRSC